MVDKKGERGETNLRLGWVVNTQGRHRADAMNSEPDRIHSTLGPEASSAGPWADSVALTQALHSTWLSLEVCMYPFCFFEPHYE